MDKKYQRNIFSLYLKHKTTKVKAFKIAKQQNCSVSKYIENLILQDYVKESKKKLK